MGVLSILIQLVKRSNHAPTAHGEGKVPMAQAWLRAAKRGFALRVLLLVGATAILSSIDVGYQAKFFGVGSQASLAHLITGLMVAVALAYRDRLPLQLVLATGTLCWLFRLEQLYGLQTVRFPALLGMVFTVIVYFTLRAMRRFVYHGGARPPPFGAGHIPRFLAFALLVLPAVYALGNLILIWPMRNVGWAMAASNTVQVFFAKFFGVLVLSLPMLMLSARADFDSRLPWWRRPMPWQPIVFGAMLPALLLKFADMEDFHIEAPLRLMLENRLFIAVLVLWASFRLKLRWSMTLLVFVEFSFATALALHANLSSALPDLFDLLRIALECLTLELMVLLLYLYGQERDEAATKFERASLIEPLSRLPNLSALRQTHANRPSAALGFLILDRSDKISASFGLQAQTVMDAWLAGQVDPFADVFHIGTGQYALLWRGEARHAAIGWEMLLKQLQAREFVWQDRRFHVLPYLGMIDPADYRDESLDVQIALAADAAQEARVRGESSVQRARPGSGPDPREQHRDNLQLSTTVLSRIRAMEVELYLQPFAPLSPLASHAGIHGELLCRLRDDEGRLIMPHRFVEQLRIDRRMAELDLTMVRQLDYWLHTNDHLIPSIGRFCINVAGQSLSSRSFARDLLIQLDTFSLPLDRLCFEVTETAAIEYPMESMALFGELRERGCHIGIDDFGVGYQSFERLKQIPADVIKIDGSFVRSMTQSPYDLSVVRATVVIAQQLGAQTVAEYVTDVETADALRELHVDWAQGFYCSTPLPIGEALARAREQDWAS